MHRNISLKRFYYIFILLLAISGCESEPVVNLLKKDLKIKVLFDDTGDLVTGSAVYMKNNNDTDQIGSVTEIENAVKGQNTVHLNILYDYRKHISSDTMFILDEPFYKGKTRILVETVEGDSPAVPLNSGAVIKGSTLTDYNLATAKKSISRFVDDVSVKTKKIIEDFRKEIESIDTDEVSKQLDKVIDDISEYSKEQKEKFKRETLPEINKMFDDLLNRLEKMGDVEEKKEIEKKYKELKDSVSI